MSISVERTDLAPEQIANNAYNDILVNLRNLPRCDRTSILNSMMRIKRQERNDPNYQNNRTEIGKAIAFGLDSSLTEEALGALADLIVQPAPRL